MGPSHMGLEKILELTRQSASRFVTTTLPAAPVLARGTFGGTLVAQSLLASLYTVPTNFVPTSLHCYFISGGDPNNMIAYDVEDLRNGRNFIHKQITAYQGQRLIFSSTILFAKEKHDHDSLHFLKTIKPSDLPDLRKFCDASSLFERKFILNDNWKRYANLQPALGNPGIIQKQLETFQFGPIAYKFPEDLFYSTADTDKLDQYISIRSSVTTTAVQYGENPFRITPANDRRYNYVAFAYLSDSYLLMTVPYFHKLPMYSHKFSVSLDHSIYFHDMPRVNDWIYLQVTNPRSHWDKHLMRGEYYDSETGEIVANVSQEGLVIYDSEREIRAKF
ncbi:hypothetical protein HG535_0B00590 [Zygotorulaspora mrakii]|uniref:Acyl-CoA thioesterase II n=1 Tax=Zygotorulaspora mrakii TaxID=42260 RepID=A0A7H9AXK5_ZYGMR|nr:uncharacterized protein HG535_0B00590 [Zygotorulaspora mrakii]QLG71021.1 hypothetical protein HG535_0B00590 [Zygotorulaspora mrakii]